MPPRRCLPAPSASSLNLSEAHSGGRHLHPDLERRAPMRLRRRRPGCHETSQLTSALPPLPPPFPLSHSLPSGKYCISPALCPASQHMHMRRVTRPAVGSGIHAAREEPRPSARAEATPRTRARWSRPRTRAGRPRLSACSPRVTPLGLCPAGSSSCNLGFVLLVPCDLGLRPFFQPNS
jgi:hypothetical protein